MAREGYNPVPEVQATTDGTGSYQNIQANPADFGGQVGAAEEKLGGTVEQSSAALGASALRMQEFTNTSNVRNLLFNKFMPDLYSKSAEYQELQGKEAHDKLPDFYKSINDTINDAANSLTSPQAREDFLANAKFSASRVMGGAAEHAAQQLKKSWIDTNTAGIANLTQGAVYTQNDPNQIAVNEAQIRSMAFDNAQHLGQSPEETKATVAAEVGKYYRQIIDAKLNTPASQGGGPQSALTLFDAVKGKMDVPSQLWVGEHLKPALRQQLSDADMTNLLTGSGPAAGGGGKTGGTVDQGAVRNTIREQSLVHGISADVPLTIAQAESATGSQADAEGSQYRGIFQMGDNEWTSVGGTAEDRGDPIAQAKRGVAFVAKDMDAARSALGHEPAGWQVWVTHVQGEKGGPALLTAPSGQNVVDALEPTAPDRATAVQRVIRNGGTTDMTVGQYLTEQQRYQRAASEVGTADANAPPPGAPDWSALEKKALSMTEGDDDRRNALLPKLSQARSRFEISTANERSALEHSQSDTEQALLSGADVAIPADRINAVFQPEEANRRILQLQLAQVAGQTIAGIKWSSPEDVSKTVHDLMDGIGTQSDLIRSKLAGLRGGITVSTQTSGANPQTVSETAEMFGMRKRIADLVVQEATKRAQTLYRDPASYIASEPSVATAGKALDDATKAGGDPTAATAAAQDFARTSLAVQEHLGVPGAAQHVLTEAQAQGMAAKLATPGVDVKQQIQGLQTQWGDAWPKVMGDLVTLGKMPAGFQSLTVLDDKNAAELARAINDTPKNGRTWEDLLGTDPAGKSIAGTIRNNIRNDPQVQTLERSLRNGGSSAEQTDSILRSIEMLAYSKKFYGQDTNAAQSAANAFTSQFRFVGGNGDARIPVKFADATMRVAADTLQDLPFRAAVPPAFRTASLPSDARNRPSAPTDEDYFLSIQSNPTWVTHGNSLWLLDNEAMPVMDRSGKPITVPFTDQMPVPRVPVATPFPQAPSRP